MGEAPSALLIGDAELDRVERLLAQLGVDFERLRDSRIQPEVSTPRRLLVVSGRCLSNLAARKSEDPTGGDPVRVCIHNQDFLPLRARLREQGFHYLVQTSLDEPSLRAFFGQLLHPLFGQRRARLPLGGTVEYRSGGGSGRARLADLSAEGCRIDAAPGLALDEPVTVLLPATLGGGTPLALPGRVMRCGDEPATGENAPFAVIRFEVLEGDTRVRLDRIVQGELVGARVAPLAEPPAHLGATAHEAPPPTPAAANPVDLEKRKEDRHTYRERVDALELIREAVVFW